ncbi:signal peptide containing protein [Theileria equi strain WA]|uniref:Signal peptide containing protein n=1 Tax=Theileria equi strain WA TaxID=1537102 RepID=L1L932_THEEQ|nr:signal peptide containing protein [Theileria equi strain WA]EKX72016.1 signal peptide containing protein [Theileria equi strain WA]|eukprot:XP_004831468.1 signal peptide containing protein [Theileria equi strain WA]
MKAIAFFFTTLIILAFTNYAIATNDEEDKGSKNLSKGEHKSGKMAKDRLTEVCKELGHYSKAVENEFKKGNILAEMTRVLIEWIQEFDLSSKRSFKEEINEMILFERNLLSEKESIYTETFTIYNEGCALLFELKEMLKSDINDFISEEKENETTIMIEAHKDILTKLEVYEVLFTEFRSFAGLTMELGLEMPGEEANGSFGPLSRGSKGLTDEDYIFDMFLGSHALPSCSKKELITMSGTIRRLLIRKLIVIKMIKTDVMEYLEKSRAIFKESRSFIEHMPRQYKTAIIQEAYGKLVHKNNQVEISGKNVLPHILSAEEDLEKFNEDINNCLPQLSRFSESQIISGKIQKLCIEAFKNSILTLEAIGETMSELLLDSSKITSAAQLVEHYFNFIKFYSEEAAKGTINGDYDESCKEGVDSVDSELNFGSCIQKSSDANEPQDCHSPSKESSIDVVKVSRELKFDDECKGNDADDKMANESDSRTENDGMLSCDVKSVFIILISLLHM